MSGWSNYKSFKGDVSQDLNDFVGGGRRLGVGTHEVVVESVELKDSKSGKPMILFVYADSKGSSKHDYVVVFKYAPSGEVIGLSINFRNVLRALIPNQELRYKFVDETRNNTTLFEALVGNKLQITIVPGKAGYEFKRDAKGITVVDVNTGEQLLPNVFDKYQEAIDAIALHNAQSPVHLERAYPDISTYAVSKDGGDFNVQKLQNTLKADAATVSVGTVSKPKFS